MKQVNFKPVNDIVLVEAKIVDEKTAAGIIKTEKMIEDEKNKMDLFLKVAAVSDDITDIQVGDEVLISGGHHNAVVLDGVTYLILRKVVIYGKKLNDDTYVSTTTESISKPSAQ
jgi:co-chaperonin GroES (HSP10)